MGRRMGLNADGLQAFVEGLLQSLQDNAGSMEDAITYID